MKNTSANEKNTCRSLPAMGCQEHPLPPGACGRCGWTQSSVLVRAQNGGMGMRKPLAPFWPHFGPSQRHDVAQQCAPARLHTCTGHVSPRCHPPRSLEENNYYANLNESRPQPTTGNINIKVRASVEGRGRTVINSITNRCPAPTKSRAETHRGEDRYRCAHVPGWNWGARPHPVRAVPPQRTRLRVAGSWLPAQN